MTPMHSLWVSLIVYVDDVLCTGPRDVVDGALGRLRSEWTCSELEWVNSEKWLKFCGLQLRWRGEELLLGQPDFARELLDRHGPVTGRQVPLPKIDTTCEVEENINPNDVKKCQQLLGELLWLSGRTRPDLAYSRVFVERHGDEMPRQGTGTWKTPAGVPPRKSGLCTGLQELSYRSGGAHGGADEDDAPV